MTATQRTTMASTPDLQPDADDAAASAPRTQSRRWIPLSGHPMEAPVAAAFTGLLIMVITTVDNKMDALVNLTPTYLAMAGAGLLVFALGTLNRNETPHTPDNENETLHTNINEVDQKLTALIAGLGMTDLVDAAVEGRLAAAEPADSEAAETEPAGAPN